MTSRRQARERRGLSLMEVLLALGVLAVSLAVVGQLSAASVRAVQRASMDSAALNCSESRLAEFILGHTKNTSDRWQSCRDRDDLEWRMRAVPQPHTSLVLVVVEVRERTQPESVFQLSRLVRNTKMMSEGL